VNRVCALVLALVLASATACDAGSAGPGPGPGPRPDADAIRTELADVVARAEPGPGDAEEGACFATTLLEQTTPDQLRDAGVLDASYHVAKDLPKLPEALAETWVDAQFRCTDFVARSAQAQEKISHGNVEPDAYAACLRDTLTDGQLRAAVVDTLTGDWDGADLDRFSTAQGDCAAESRR
jgi:hypothetical protein